MGLFYICNIEIFLPCSILVMRPKYGTLSSEPSLLEVLLFRSLHKASDMEILSADIETDVLRVLSKWNYRTVLRWTTETSIACYVLYSGTYSSE